jgi:hypothetical protein
LDDAAVFFIFISQYVLAGGLLPVEVLSVLEKSDLVSKHPFRR